MRGTILIDHAGQIAGVAPTSSVGETEDWPTLGLPDATVLPGLVNAHTHLELSRVGQVDEPEFPDWIHRVRQIKEALQPEDFRAAAWSGVRDAWAHGITTVGDTGDSGAVAEALAGLGGRGVVYQEVFGPHPDQSDGALAALIATVTRLLADYGSERVTIGVSPHAPYTVSERLYGRVTEFAIEARLPIAVHVAESCAEFAFVVGGDGIFADRWRRRGLPPIVRARSPVEFLRRAGVLEAEPLIIHGVQIDRADIDHLVGCGCAVVTCPESNRVHGHGDPPIRAWRAAGVRLGVGTDSVASVGSIDLFPDARAVRRLGGLTGEQTLRIMTLGGAEALSLDATIGSLERGKHADLCIVQSPEVGSEATSADDILAAGSGAVLRTYVAGRLVFDSAAERSSSGERS